MLGEHPHQNVEHRAGQNLGERMRFELTREALHRLLVQCAAQIWVAGDRLAELLRQRGQKRIGLQIAVALLENEGPERIVSNRHEDGGEVAQELVKRGRLRTDRFVEIRPQAVEHRVAEFVVHDVGGKAGVDASLVAVEPIELERLAGPIVIGVFAVTGMRHDDQAVTLERPTDPSAKREAALEEIERVLNRGPDAELVILEERDRLSIEDGAVGPEITILSPVPDRRRGERIAGRIVVHHGKARAGRTVAKAGLPGRGEFGVDADVLVKLGDARVLEIDLDRHAQTGLLQRVKPQVAPRRIKLDQSTAGELAIRFSRRNLACRFGRRLDLLAHAVAPPASPRGIPRNARRDNSWRKPRSQA
jgi:hypothetical protein